MNIVVIGNGIAGITAALRLRRIKPKWRITVISAESSFFFSRPALMYIYMGHLSFEDTKPYQDRFWEHMAIERVLGRVVGIDTKSQIVFLQNDNRISYDRLLIASGSEPNKLGWPGENLERVQGFYSLQDLQKLERNTQGIRRVVIVGGGLIGVELAEMLHTRGVSVCLLVREASYWNNIMPNHESEMINDIIREAGVELRLKSELQEIVDDGKGRACVVVTKAGERIECQMVGLTAGVHPNLSAITGSSIPAGRGILVDPSLRTKIPNIFAAGDCAEIVDEQGQHRIWQVWYTGKMQGELAARVMAGENVRYKPGIWYNSAKFIDLEWQTYGQITCGMDANKPNNPACLFWKHEDGRHCVRVVHRDGVVIGFNVMGIRYRHRICERWIEEERSVRDVLKHLGQANFDPEFFRRYEPDMVGTFKEQLQ